MDYLSQAICRKRAEYENLKKLLDESLSSAPSGRLRVCKSRGRAQYRYRPEFPARSSRSAELKSTSGESPDYENRERSLHLKSEANLIERLIQRDFDARLLREVEKQLDRIGQIEALYDEKALEIVFSLLHPERRKVVSSPYLSDEEFAARWEAMERPHKPFEEGLAEIYSERGERVRSKSEKLIADKLLMMGIPYQYEIPLVLDRKTIYPDFTLLHAGRRTECYLEHFGRIGDPGYCENNLIWRLDEYERNHIYPGDRLLITRESSRRPLDMRQVENMLRWFFDL